MNSVGTITVTLDGATLDDTERCRAIINALFSQGVFNLRPGQAILNFDDTGSLKIEVVRVSRYKFPPLQKALKSATIEVLNPAVAFELNERLKRGVPIE